MLISLEMKKNMNYKVLQNENCKEKKINKLYSFENFQQKKFLDLFLNNLYVFFHCLDIRYFSSLIFITHNLQIQKTKSQIFVDP